MSLRAMTYVQDLTHDPHGRKLTRTEKFVLLMLAHAHNDHQNVAWPSLKTLTEECLISKQGLVTTLKHLATRGLLTVTARADERGWSLRNEYAFPLLPVRGQATRPLSQDIGSQVRLDRGVKLHAVQGSSFGLTRGQVGVASEENSSPENIEEKKHEEKKHEETPMRPTHTPPSADPQALGGAHEHVFEMGFWKVYPSRDGKRLEKQATKRCFLALSLADQELASLAAAHYAASRRVREGIGIKDPKRFLRDGQGNEPWRDWIEPERAGKTASSVQGLTVCRRRVQQGFRLRACGKPLDETDRGTPGAVCADCRAEQTRLNAASPTRASPAPA